MEAAVVGARSKPLGSLLMPKVEEHFSYVFSNKKHIEELSTGVNRLQNKRIGVDKRVQDAENQGKVVMPHIVEWQEQVEQIIEKTSRFDVKTRDSDAKCCFMLCDNICYLYKNSKEAASLNKEVAKKYQEAMSFDEVATSSHPPPITVSYAATCGERFESKHEILAQIVNLLQNDEVNVIGICGMGGVGKTTLVEKLILQAQDQKLFDIVAKVVISKTPNIMDIQNQIAERIKFKFDASTEQGQANQLHQILSVKLEEEKKKILMILDDVWVDLDFTAKIGIPRMKSCNVVITSRFRNVLIARPINVDKLIEVGVLEMEEARNLFKMSLGDASAIKDEDSQFKAVTDDLLKYCGGLPLAIVTLAGLLKTKDYTYWLYVADRLSEHSGKEIEELNHKVWKTIELSYASLVTGWAQMLFLLCSLFPEDAQIEVHRLMSCALGIHLFGDKCSLDKAMVRVHGVIDGLISCSLLLSTNDAYYVRMHDVVREVAIDIASRGEYNFFTGTSWPKKEDLAIKCAISQSINDFENTGGHFPKLEILCLQVMRNRSVISFPTDFFRGMENLKVLDMYRDGGVIDLGSQPSIFQPLVNLRTLHLTAEDVKSISKIGQLTNLEYLYLKVYRLFELPETFKELTHLKVLELSGCHQLKRIPANVISSLSQLEGLLLHKRDALVNPFELQSCSHLKVVKALLRVIDDSQMLHNVSKVESIFSNLFHFHLIITSKVNPVESAWERLMNTEVRLKSSVNIDKALCLFNVPIRSRISPVMFPSVSKFWEGLQLLDCDDVEDLHDLRGIKFPSLRRLYLSCCKDMKYVIAPDDVLPNLELLVLHKLPQLEGVFGQDGALWKSSFPALKQILLVDLPNIKSNTNPTSDAHNIRYIFGLEDVLPAIDSVDIEGVDCDEIWCCPPVADSFSHLQRIHIFELPHVRYLFPTLTFCTQLFKRLRSLVIGDCKNMEVVILGAEEEDIANQTNIISIIPSLEYISLRQLPSLLYFYGGTNTLKFPLLRSVRIYQCPGMNSLAPGSRTVRSVTVEEASKIGLNTLFKEKWLKEDAFPAVEDIDIGGIDCYEIWRRPPTTDSFSLLRGLYISELSPLRSLFPSLTFCVQLFKRLKSLQVRDCQNLEVVIFGAEEGDEDEDVTTPTSIISVISSLQVIVLWGLPRLSYFYDGRHTLKFPLLREVVATNCPSMKSFAPTSPIAPSRFLIDNCFNIFIKEMVKRESSETSDEDGTT